MSITAEYVQSFLMNSAGIELPIHEAEDLAVLVQAQRAALNRLEPFDVAGVRPNLRFDPRSAYCA
jgi:hypothetical protein